MESNFLITEILIIGAGPTGLLLANFLGKMGVKTLLVEKTYQQCKNQELFQSTMSRCEHYKL